MEQIPKKLTVKEIKEMDSTSRRAVFEKLFSSKNTKIIKKKFMGKELHAIISSAIPEVTFYTVGELRKAFPKISINSKTLYRIHFPKRVILSEKELAARLRMLGMKICDSVSALEEEYAKELVEETMEKPEESEELEESEESEDDMIPRRLARVKHTPIKPVTNHTSAPKRAPKRASKRAAPEPEMPSAKRHASESPDASNEDREEESDAKLLERCFLSAYERLSAVENGTTPAMDQHVLTLYAKKNKMNF